MPLLLGSRTLPAAICTSARGTRDVAGPLASQLAQQVLQQVRPWIEPAQSFEKNQLGLGDVFFNSLRFTWAMALVADVAVLLRAASTARTTAPAPIACEPAATSTFS